MVLFNTFDFVVLGANLRSLTLLPQEARLSEIYDNLTSARRQLLRVFNESSVPLPLCATEAQEIINVIDEIIALSYGNPQEEEENGDVDFGVEVGLTLTTNLKQQVSALMFVMQAELRSGVTYAVSDTGAFNTRDLLENPEKLMPEHLQYVLPMDALVDLDQCCKCIAFGLPTAAGFHIARSTEATMRAYYEEKVGDLPANGQQRSWGSLINKLKEPEYAVPPRIVGYLTQIKDYHRNPLIHPEQSLEMADALELLHVCLGAMIQMTGDMNQDENEATDDMEE